jgi:hypothetical protein
MDKALVMAKLTERLNFYVSRGWNYYIDQIKSTIESYERGEIIFVYSESDYNNGMEYVTEYYSDGTTQQAVYSTY